MTKEEKLRRDRGFEISHFEPQTEPHRSRGVTCKFVEEGKVSAEIINYIVTTKETIDKGMTIVHEREESIFSKISVYFEV